MASNIIPPPSQNPPTIKDIDRARVYETDINLQCANAPTDAECGEIVQYPLTVATENAPAGVPAWFNGALQAALAPILQEVQGLRDDVGRMRQELVVLSNHAKGDGLRMPFAAVHDENGNLPSPALNLPELQNINVLNDLTHDQALGWYQHYFPEGANESRTAMVNQIAHHIGYSAAL
ncbi:hypothetical protein C8J55DRAFT_602301 [Lentinula edodes]|uniref:Mug135-like C-terminal domain-containing protein n=1 Tax=Lentinula lateritia TaxID=40482 RepID=A0A9W9AZ26_9AGAR|nr:hypothetical protein C8J55DRAFT_602301 [Lentinula edodes]